MMVQNGENALSTDDSFRRQTQFINQQGHFDFVELDINMIWTFLLDTVHIVYLGVTKKLINLW